MRPVFADTHYWVAVTHPRDPWRAAAQQARAALDAPLLVTTEEVLTEFLNTFARHGEALRRAAIASLAAIRTSPHVRVLAQTPGSFARAVDLYTQRPDKSYSLTDCVSMNAMREDGITEVLTNDHGFEQEGFVVLIQPAR
jgi:predicted nucleic acid-binding protein